MIYFLEVKNIKKLEIREQVFVNILKKYLIYDIKNISSGYFNLKRTNLKRGTNGRK